MTKQQQRSMLARLTDRIESEISGLERFEAEEVLSELRDALYTTEHNLGDILDCERPAEEHPSLTASQRNGGR